MLNRINEKNHSCFPQNHFLIHLSSTEPGGSRFWSWEPLWVLQVLMLRSRAPWCLLKKISRFHQVSHSHVTIKSKKHLLISDHVIIDSLTPPPSLISCHGNQKEGES